MHGTAIPFPGKEESLPLLRRDYVFGRIPEEQHQKIVDDAWDMGQKSGEVFLNTYSIHYAAHFIDFMRAAGLKVRKTDVDYISGTIRYFADIQPKAMLVCVYTKSIALWACQHGCDYQLAEDLILIHEFFHYIESRQKHPASHIYTVPMLKTRFLSIGKTGVASLSEIAANSFVWKLWDADFMQIRTKWQASQMNMKTG